MSKYLNLFWFLGFIWLESALYLTIWHFPTAWRFLSVCVIHRNLHSINYIDNYGIVYRTSNDTNSLIKSRKNNLKKFIYSIIKAIIIPHRQNLDGFKMDNCRIFKLGDKFSIPRKCEKVQTERFLRSEPTHTHMSVT